VTNTNDTLGVNWANVDRCYWEPHDVIELAIGTVRTVQCLLLERPAMCRKGGFEKKATKIKPPCETAVLTAAKRVTPPFIAAEIHVDCRQTRYPFCGAEFYLLSPLFRTPNGALLREVASPEQKAVEAFHLQPRSAGPKKAKGDDATPHPPSSLNSSIQLEWAMLQHLRWAFQLSR
jgi:hypothetical protein